MRAVDSRAWGVEAVHHSGEIALEEVGVDVESDRGGAMAELLLDLFHVGTGGTHEQCAVPKVVWGESAKSVPAVALAGFQTLRRKLELRSGPPDEEVNHEGVGLVRRLIQLLSDEVGDEPWASGRFGVGSSLASR